MSSDNPHSPAPTPPHDPVSADESRVLAVLLGEASPFETESVAELLSRRPDLRAYHDRASALLGLLPDATKPDAAAEPALRLDDTRREALLEKLREPAGTDSVSDTTIQFPADAASRRGRLIGFFRVALVSSRRYAALLAVLLVVGVGGLAVLAPLSKKVRSSHRAEFQGLAPESESAQVGFMGDSGAGGGANGDKAKAFEAKGHKSRERFDYAKPGESNLYLAPSRIVSKSVGASVALPSEPKPASEVASGELAAASSGVDGLSVRAKVESESEYVFRGNSHSDANVQTKVAGDIGRFEQQSDHAFRFSRQLSDGDVVGSAPAPVITPAEASEPVPESPSAPAPKGAKGGEGRLTLSGVNTYTGDTTITAGTRMPNNGFVGQFSDTFPRDEAGAAPADHGAIDDYAERRKTDARPGFKGAVSSGPSARDGYEEAGTKTELSGFANGLSAGGMSKGFGGGSGGGEGAGIGIGSGRSRNYSDGDKAAEVVEGIPASGLHDKVPVLGDLPVVGKLYANEDGRGNAPKESLVELEKDGGAQTGKDSMREGKKQNADRALKAKLLEEVDTKWAVTDEFTKSLGSAKGKVAAKPIVRLAPKPAPVPVAQTETPTEANAFSTFSLNVSDVSFRLAVEAARRGAYPDSGGIRTEEFVNAQRYRDPAPRAEEPVALTQEQARHPFAHNRNLVRLSLKTNAEGRSAQQPLSLVVLMDNSGSMERSDRRETVAAAANTLAANLRPGDKVSVIGFARDTRLLVDRMDGANTKPLLDLANNPPPTEGGTNMENALNTAYSQLARQTPAGVPGRVVLLTDGAANLGDADPARLATMVETNRLRGRALDAYGVGFDGYDDGMLERLSRKGDGRYAFLNNADDAGAELGAKLAGALRPFANDVKVQVEFNPARVASWRLLGYDNHRLRKQDFRDNTVDAAELAAAEAGTALYAYEPKADGVGDVGVVRVRYRVPGTQDYREREWPIPYEAPPAFADAPEGVRLAGCSAFVAEALGNNPNAATTDRAELRKQVSRLASTRPGDRPLSDLRILAERLANTR